jgi:hypothetical protein
VSANVLPDCYGHAPTSEAATVPKFSQHQDGISATVGIGATWQARLIQLGDEQQVIARKSCWDTWEAATHVPDAYADFVAHVVPELQRRGLCRKNYRL